MSSFSSNILLPEILPSFASGGANNRQSPEASTIESTVEEEVILRGSRLLVRLKFGDPMSLASRITRPTRPAALF